MYSDFYISKITSINILSLYYSRSNNKYTHGYGFPLSSKIKFTAEPDGDISFNAGDILEVNVPWKFDGTFEEPLGWLKGVHCLTKKIGTFPANRVIYCGTRTSTELSSPPLPQRSTNGKT